MAYVLGRRKPNLTFPTLTGNIITFNSQYAGLPLKSCKVNIPVTQEGTGDPSPDNVRNFVRVNSLDFSATGKNLFNKATVTLGKWLTNKGAEHISQNGAYSDYIPIVTNIPYYFSHIIGLTSFFSMCVYDENKTFLESVSLSGRNDVSGTVTFSQGSYIRVNVYRTTLDICQIEKGSIATDHESFGNNKLFTFGQTIYAGELDVLTGILTVTHVYLHITTVNVMNSQRANVGVGGNRTVAVQLDQNELRCNILKSETFSSALDNHIHFSNVQTLQLYMAEEIGTTVAEWETWLSDHPLYVCYKLETPEVINLGGMDISTLQGENNLFASTGETTVEYIKIGG